MDPGNFPLISNEYDLGITFDNMMSRDWWNINGWEMSCHYGIVMF